MAQERKRVEGTPAPYSRFGVKWKPGSAEQIHNPEHSLRITSNEKALLLRYQRTAQGARVGG